MLVNNRKARARAVNFGLQATIALLGVLALGYVEVQAMAQPLYDLGPDILAEPELASVEPSAALMVVWNALPVFKLKPVKPFGRSASHFQDELGAASN
jgi:hypothetical protein